jgi:hypothetical protein
LKLLFFANKGCPQRAIFESKAAAVLPPGLKITVATDND